RSQRKQILEESASDTTIHGIPRTVGDRHPAVKALWLLAFIAFVGFLTRQFVMAVIKLRSLPVSTSIEPNSATFEFPDVHFCSQPMISASYPSTMGAEARNFTDAQTAKIVQLLDRFNASHPYFVAVALVNTLPTSFLSENFGMRKEQSIVKATVMPMNVELEFDKDIESFGHYKYLNCFRVRPKQNDIQSMLGNVLAYLDIFLYADATYNQSVKFYAGHIESRGLSFTGYENLLGSGFRVYFTPKYGYPDEFSPSVTIAPGYTHFIKLSMQVTNWAEKKGQCLSDQPNVQYVDLAKAEPGSYRYNLYACYAKELANIYATNLEANLPGMLPIPYSQKDLPNIYNFSQIGPNASDSEILNRLVFMKKITNGQLT
uniref:Amiloride-sensitive cation channel 5 n=1 Tax=Macrostomum lignano TaxID=282301 RepID=A0A1I8ICX5_9PLAT